MGAKLLGSMILATAATIGITTLGIFLIGEIFGGIPILLALLFAIGLVIFQWIIAPKIIQYAFGLIPAEKAGLGWLIESAEKIAKRTGMKKSPEVYVSPSPIANAFAFGNVFSGKKVAVTKGLLNILSEDEVEAVIAHELGHIRHKDIEIMMALSVLPAIFYLLARWLYYASFFRGVTRGRGSERLVLPLVAALAFFFYFVVSIFMLWVSRLREYYADQNAVESVEGGGIRLARALAKLEYYNSQVITQIRPEKSIIAFKFLMISDPERKIPRYPVSNVDELVYQLASKEITFSESISEIFRSHPLTPKRIRRLLKLSGIIVK